MVSKSMKIDDLKTIFIKNIKKLDMDKYAKKCRKQFQKTLPIFKDVMISEKAMSEGNTLYHFKDLNFAQLYQIMILYNESIALAPHDSEQLVVAYANKTALLQRMRKYNECISEIDQVLKIVESISLKVKLLCRKVECLTSLGSSDNRSCLERARFIMTKFEGPEEDKVILNKLIQKTQLVIDKNQIDIPKEEKRKTQALKLIEEVKQAGIEKSIRVEYSETQGRHLIAARDFDPGDIILAEKPYINILDDSRVHQYCNYCFAHLWTAVPCKTCAIRLYCSEKCKSESWKEHHEIDCYALLCMRITFGSNWTPRYPILVSVFCKALKEAGSIEQLLLDSEPPSQCEDPNDDWSILTSTDFTNHKTIFTLPLRNKVRKDWKIFIERTIAILIGLAKFTKVLGKTYDFKDMTKLINDDKAMLAGALLLKLDMMISISPLVRLVDPNRLDTDDGESGFKGPYNHSFPLATLHTLEGCVPNVYSFPSQGNQYIICALRPIKAGEPLISYLTSISIWNKRTKAERQERHIETYGCPCNCQACTEDWAESLDNMKDSMILDFRNPIGLKLWEERNSIISDWEANKHKFNFPDIKIVSRAANLVDTAWKEFSMPSAIMLRSVYILEDVLDAFHDPSEICVKNPSLRSLMKYESVYDIQKILKESTNDATNSEKGS